MELNARERGDVLVLDVIDKRLDAYAASDFRAKLLAHIGRGKRHLVVNLGNVTFVDSSGLSALVSALKRLAGDGELKVCTLSPSVRTMFELTRLYRVITMFDTEDEAVESFAAA